MTILEGKKERIKEARESGYRYLSYTYSTLQDAREQSGSFAVAHEDSTAKWTESDIIAEDQLYTCCIYDLEEGEGKTVLVVERGETAESAKEKAMAELAGILLRGKIDHWMDFNSVKILSKNEDVLMGEQLRTWLSNNNLSQNKAAELCSVTPRTFRRWVLGRPSMPQGMWELLRIRASKVPANNADN
ncbi:MAG: hypothetical protein FWH12_02520 [Treponema sp.]|nr:hypothetical protein [Treponema sp.]